METAQNTQIKKWASRLRMTVRTNLVDLLRWFITLQNIFENKVLGSKRVFYNMRALICFNLHEVKFSRFLNVLMIDQI